MIIYNSKTINDWNFDTSNLIKVYRNNAICYYKVSGGGDVPTAQTPCYAVVTDITQYQDTEFVDVYNKADESWYKLNNLNQYEKYGVYGSGRTITNYEGKLTIDDGYEYIYSGNSWVNVGEVSGSSITIKSPEYIERTSSYKGYCSLLEYLTQDTKIIIKHKQTAAGGGRIIGDYNSNDKDDWRFFFFGSTLYYDFITQRKSTSFGMPMSAAQEWEVGNYYIKNTASSNILTGTPQTFSSRPAPMYIYHSDGVGAGESGTDYGQIYYIKIYRGDTLVRDFIPWTDMEGNYGLYDKVQNELVHTVGSMTASTTINDVEVGGGYSYPIYYSDKIDPPIEVSFDTMDEALAYDCPYVGLIALIDGQAYMFNDEYEWEQLAFTITGTTTSSDPFSLKLNLEDAAVTVYQDNGDGTYNWGIYYPTPITNTSGLCRGNTSLRSFDWGDADTSGLTTLGNYSFSNCKSLTTMPSIPSNVTTIGNNAFEGCTGISSSTITIPEGITTIGGYSFQSFFRNGTKTLNLPSTLSSIGGYAFNDSNQTVNVTIDSLEHWLNLSYSNEGSNPIISQGWLYINGNRIQDVTIPNNISQIKGFAFYNYKHLNSLTIPSNVTSIGYYAFYGVSPITSVTIPSSVTFIGQNSFYYSSLKNVVYNSSAYHNYIFAHCSSLSSVTLSNITRIGYGMFQFCYALSSITIPSSVTYIDDYGFGSCTELSSVDIPSSVTTIGRNAFGSCFKLSSITVEATTPPTLYNSSFQGCTALSKIYVPCQSVSAYRSASNWSTYADKIVGYEECTTYEWQTISSAYTCYEGDKYEKQQKMRSFDSGTTWEAVVPYEYQIGQLIESGSSDCGCRLPDGYTEVEYIENSGTTSSTCAFINLGIALYDQADNTFTVVSRLKSEYYSASGDGTMETIINSEGINYPYNGFVYRYKYNTGGQQLELGGNNNNATLTTVENEDGSRTVTIQSVSAATFTAQTPLGLFASYNGSYTNPYRPSKTKIYSCQVTLNNALMRDLVPAKRDSDSKYGLYDLVNDEFYISPNGNNFVGGPEVPCGSQVPSDYQELEYAQTVRTTQPIASGFTVPIDLQENYNYSFEFTPLDWYGSNGNYYGLVVGGNDAADAFWNYGIFKLDNGWGSEYYRTTSAFYNYKLGTRSIEPLSGKYRFYDNVKSKVTMHCHNYDQTQGADIIVENEGYSTYSGTSTTRNSNYRPSDGIYNIPLFSTISGKSTSTAYIKFHSLTVTNYQTGAAVYNYVPVIRKSDSKVGLYDIVNQEFYAPLFNLTAGPEVH